MPASAKVGTWIYERTSPSGGGSGGGTVIPPAPPVTILEDLITIGEKENGLVEIVVPWQKHPDATEANFLGAKVYLEDPDLSDKALAPLDGTQTLGSATTPRAQLAGAFRAIFKNDSFTSPATLVVPGQSDWRPVRIYLASFGPSKTVKLVPANAAAPAVPTTNVRLGIGAVQGSYVSGMEHTWLVTNQDAIPETDFDGPSGPRYRLLFDFKPPEAVFGKGITSAATYILTKSSGPDFSSQWEGKAIIVDGKAYKVREVIDATNLKLDTEPPDSAGLVWWTVLYGAPLPRPPGLKPFAGVQIVYERADGTREQGQFLDINKPEEWVSPYFPIKETQTYRVYFVSQDIEGHLNEIKSVTPFKLVQVVYPPGGQGPTPDVTGFTITNSRHETEIDYTMYALADFAWTVPTSARYSGVSIYRVGIDPPKLFGTYPPTVTKTTISVNDLPDPSQTWTFAAIAYNLDGKPTADPKLYPWTGRPEATRVPTAIWVVGKPQDGGAGIEYAPLVTKAGTVSTEQILNTDGMVMMRHVITGWTEPTDNRFGGISIARRALNKTEDVQYTFWEVPKGVTSFTTPWEPSPSARTYAFYFLSRSGEGKRNTIQANTPYTIYDHVPIQGDVIVSRLPKGWWDESEFEWPEGGQFSAEQFLAKKIYVGKILRVGGGSTAGQSKPDFAGFENGQIAVYNNANELRAWAGQQDNVILPTASGASPQVVSVYGGWFYELYVGGTSPATAPVYTNRNGEVIIGGWDVQGSRYPRVSIRNEFGVEVGAIGAKLAFAQSPPVTGDAQYVSGGWFKELAVGGQNMNDWRILAKRATSGSTQEQDLIRIRNVNRFTIDYIQNYTPSSNPSNEPITMDFGFDAFVADSTNPSYWKIPGFKLARTDAPTNGMTLIHRGIVINGPGFLRKASLVTWNGNQFSNPLSPIDVWWGELSLMSPHPDPSRSGTVLLRGGSASDEALQGWAVGSVFGNHNCALFLMRDENANTNFSVDQRGNVYAKNNVKIDGALIVNSMSLSSLTVTGQTKTGTLLVQNAVGTYGAIEGGSLDLHTGSIVNAASITATGTVAVTGSGKFQGPLTGNVTGNLSGNVSGTTVTATGAITGGSFATAVGNFLDGNNKFIGKGVDVTTAYDIKGRGIYGELFYHKSNLIIDANGVFLGGGVNTGQWGISGGHFNVFVPSENKTYNGIKVRFVGADGYAYYVIGGIIVDTTNPNKGTWT